MMLLLALLFSAALASALPHPHDRPTGNSDIIGGVEAEHGEFPFIVDIQFCPNYPSYCYHYCGGSIYNEQWIITAAHCVGGPLNNYTVTSGEHDLSRDDGSEQVRKLSQIIIHEEYNHPSPVANDIALLKLVSPLDIDYYTYYIPIPPQDVVITQDAIIAGWGSQDDGTLPDVLRKVMVPIVTDEKCREEFEIEDTMLCAGYAEGGKDSCGGDSGGPLITNYRGQTTLTGVVSWGYGCALPDLYGVYTEVACYNDWIRRNIANTRPDTNGHSN